MKKGNGEGRFSIAPDESLIQYATGKGNYYGRDQRADSRGYGEGLASEGTQNEQLMKSLSTEEKHRQFDERIAKLDGSRGAR